jgi:S-adenosylmethionine:tRNA ribosyltransferase-isomerase
MNALAFALPAALEATSPPETRGVPRDQVGLLVADRRDGSITHERFDRLPEILGGGDLVVINVSATLAAAVPGHRADGTPVRVHFSTAAPRLGPRWRVVELRSRDGSRPARGRPGETITFAAAGPGHPELELVARYAAGTRLLLARLAGELTLPELLAIAGEPIRYGYAARPWPLWAYQNVYAIDPGSAEMPSAGRPMTNRLLARLIARGIAVAPLTLHTGVSSPERHEAPFPERYEVPAMTARLVNATRTGGGRVIAVGTTVVRALETVADGDGTVAADAGWTGLVIDADRGVRSVDGLITGWHEPEASHLNMLAAIAGPALLERSYAEALGRGYLWHEFGDSHLILASG